jgi:hypothetical protein
MCLNDFFKLDTLSDIKTLCTDKLYLSIYKNNKDIILTNMKIKYNITSSNNYLFYYNDISTKDSDDEILKFFFDKLYNKTHLQCNRLGFDELPYLPKLEKLFCNDNQLTTLPEYPELKKLICNDNKLTTLPNYPKLTTFSCSNNKLTTLPEYPELDELYCDNNKLITLLNYPN